MKQEAELVLFKLNRLDFNFDLQRAFKFLSGLETHKLLCIRHIRFVFSYKGLCNHGPWIRFKWRSIIHYIKDNLDVGKLCIVVDMRQDLDDYSDPESDYEREDARICMLVYRMVCELVVELMILRCKLQDLHLHFPLFKWLEALLERQVMGDEYNNYRGNKRPKKWNSYEERHTTLPLWHADAWKILVGMINTTAGNVV